MLKRPLTSELNAWQFRFGDEPWQEVCVPHSWNALDALQVGEDRYRRGVGFYRTEVTTPPAVRTFIRFGAASQKAMITWQGREIGCHAGGYLPFTVELPPGERGQLIAAVDNRPDADLIPSERSDFFLYGGLTRPVLRYATGLLRIDHLHATPTLAGQDGMLHLRASVDGQAAGAAVWAVTLEEPGGGQHHQLTTPLTGRTTAITLPTITDPQRWSPDTPVLYRLRVSLLHNGTISDGGLLDFGWRSFDFPAGGPFFLNGARVLLRGTHRHEDWAGCGSAVPAAYTRAELAHIKAAGFNFIRLGHYPQDADVLDLCDELGLIVWEELPWCRGGVGGERFKEQARAMLRAMIAAHHHHPSIVFWGLGNELDWESDHTDTTDDDVLAFLQELHALAHTLDPARLTALRRYERGARVVDVYSPSIWSGWYRGRYEDYALALTDAQARYPRLLHIEWGGDSHVGRHNSGPHLPAELPHERDHAEQDGLAYSQAGFARASRDGDWSESYMLDLVARHLAVQQAQPNLAGTAQWAFKDFGTPLRPENPLPYVNQKGLVDRANRPKSVYYLFQAAQTATPVCRIEAATWPVRAGDPDQAHRVRVITNCATAELFVNGVSQGARVEGWLRTWWVALRMGENRLRVLGRTRAGELVEDELTQQLVPPCAAAPSRWLVWSAPASYCDRPALSVTAQLATEEGTPCLQPERRVEFMLVRGGRLLVDQGTPDGSRCLTTANGRATILVLDIQEAPCVLSIAAEGMAPTWWQISHGSAEPCKPTS